MKYLILLLFFLLVSPSTYPNELGNSILTTFKKIETIYYVISILLGIITILGFIYKPNFFKKKEIQDFKIATQYFSKENIDKLSSESTILQDMAIKTTYIFNGLSFKQLKCLLEMKEIHLYEIDNLRKLTKSKYLNYDFSINKKYKKSCNPYLFLMISFILFIVYIFIIAYIKSCLEEKYGIFSEKINLILFIIFLAIPEVFWLFSIEKRFSIPKDIKWYEKNKDRFQNISIIINKNRSKKCQ